MTRAVSNARGFSISYKRGCDITMNDSHGEIISPGYLATAYPNDVTCTYTIENEDPKADRSLSLIPNRFDLADDDFVKVFENSVKGKSLHESEGFSSRTKPEKQIDSEANRLQVVFKSSASRRAMGFNFTYSIGMQILALIWLTSPWFQTVHHYHRFRWLLFLRRTVPSTQKSPCPVQLDSSLLLEKDYRRMWNV